MDRPSFETALYQEDGAIAILTLNRPDKLNALDERSRHDLALFAEYLNGAEQLRAGIITGAGQQAFCAGADVGSLQCYSPVTSTRKNWLRIALRQIETGPKPVIAAVNGYAFGGGFELALACDIRIASERAVFGFPEPDLGLIPGAGGTQRLTKLAGMGVAKDVILAGRKLNAQEAVTYGIAMKTVPAEEIMTETLKAARRMLARGPVALQVGKHLINASAHADMDTGLLLEALGTGLLFGSEDLHEGLNAYLAKRKPEFKGR